MEWQWNEWLSYYSINYMDMAFKPRIDFLSITLSELTKRYKLAPEVVEQVPEARSIC